jgi:hypothetical protein
MSYLDVPRLHFYGDFTADPSTINNQPVNYELLAPPFSPPPSKLDLGWIPNGSHAWTFEKCKVRTVIGSDGLPSRDALVGTGVFSSGSVPKSSPKLVDLDPEQQWVSMIFGLRIEIGDPASGTVSGVFQPQPLNDLAPSQTGAYYQSVLQDLVWSPDPASPALQELRRISPEALSIKFVVNQKPGRALHPVGGTVTGTIGPAFPGEPANFLLGRLMRPPGPILPVVIRGHVPPSLVVQSTQPNYTPFVVDGKRKKVIVDFGNTFQTFDRSGMQLAILPGRSTPRIDLGAVDNSVASFQARAAIQEFDVTEEQVSALKSSTLGVILGESWILAEDENATSLAVTPMVCRLNPGESVQIDLVALSFGVPAAHQTIGFGFDNRRFQPVPGVPVGTPSWALQLPVNGVTTDGNGRASFVLSAAPKGPGNPRGKLDGQIYGVGFHWPLAHNPDPWTFVSVHVYDLVPVPILPDWDNDVLPILGPYHDLYPYMANMINLADRKAVLRNARQIESRLKYPETDPRHMPVTRDLSANKRQIVLNWLAQKDASG